LRGTGMNKNELRNLLGQMISMREDLKNLMRTGLDWETISEIYDDLRAAIADLEEIIDS
tara:strand:+ start:1417 stop:1593 length:177 start_codon:yes stop_codon:yes gene_type:complete